MIKFNIDHWKMQADLKDKILHVLYLAQGSLTEPAITAAVAFADHIAIHTAMLELVLDGTCEVVVTNPEKLYDVSSYMFKFPDVAPSTA